MVWQFVGNLKVRILPTKRGRNFVNLEIYRLNFLPLQLSFLSISAFFKARAYFRPQEIGKFYVLQDRRKTGEALKLRKGSSGGDAFLSRGHNLWTLNSFFGFEPLYVGTVVGSS